MWNEVKKKKLNGEEHWRMKPQKESALMLSYEDVLNRPNIEISTLRESFLNKEEK